MASLDLRYGQEAVRLDLPPGLDVRVAGGRVPRAPEAPEDPLAVVARALDEPVSGAALLSRAKGVKRATLVVPDDARPGELQPALLPTIARLAQAGLGPAQIRVVVARGLHGASPRAAVQARIGADVMASLKVVQSAPDSPDLNQTLLEDDELGEVRVHGWVADADLVVLVGVVAPHHLAGWGGGAKALVPGTAERDTVLAAHRLTLRAVLRPDGDVRSLAGRSQANPFREAVDRVAEASSRCFLLSLVVDAGGRIVAAASGDVRAAHERAVEAWQAATPAEEVAPHDLVIVGGGHPFDRNLIQAQKALLAARPWAGKDGAILWLARASEGPGHPRYLPWFEIRRLPDHLAALRRDFHPYGLTAYILRRICRERPVYVASDLSADLLRPMGLLPFDRPAAALAYALGDREVKSVAVLP